MMNYKKSFFDKRGLTLVEVLVTLAILSLVFLVAYNIFFHNFRTFGRGEERSQVQYDVRMATDFINREVRNASEFSGTVALDQFIDLNTLQDRYSSITDVTFTIVRENRRYLLEYVVTGDSPKLNNSYQLETKILLNNIYRSNFKSDIEVDNLSNIEKVYYNKDN